MDKRILSIALAGYRMILFDNLETGGALGGAALDAALTGTSYNGRILAKSEMANDVPLFTVWYATGNNLGLRGDALRRIVPCRLESQVERPEERTGFKYPDLLGHVQEKRGELVAAALTILRAYFVAGCPKPHGTLTPIDYPAWEKVIRAAICWAIGIDPCGTRKGLIEQDTESNQHAAVIAGWKPLCESEQKESLTSAEAVAAIEKDSTLQQPRHAALRSIFIEWSRDGKLPSPRVVGNRLNKIRGKVSGRGDDAKCLDFKTLDGNRSWFVKPMGSSPQSGSSDPSDSISTSTRTRFGNIDRYNSGSVYKNHTGNEAIQSHLSHLSHLDANEREVIEL
jgi:hypothetical protein